MNSNFVNVLDEYLKQRRIVDIKNFDNAVIDREKGKTFTFSDHLKALIYSLLTNQRKWSDVEPKLPYIDKLFFNYDYQRILQYPGSYFEDGIRKLHCGNISIKAQMNSLADNIRLMKEIESKYGSMDEFVISDSPEKIVMLISDSKSKYKFKGLGNALAWEYLRNVGIDGSKPDLHLKRFFGSERMGVSKQVEASDDEVIDAVARISRETGYSKFEVDYLIWSYCASGKGEVCTLNPNCNKCVIRNYCNK